MKDAIKVIFVLAIVTATGVWFAFYMTGRWEQESFEAKVIIVENQQKDAPLKSLEVLMDEEIFLSVDEWIEQKYPEGQITGGAEPYKLTATSVPFGIDAGLDGARIFFQGIPKEWGTFNASLSVQDSEGRVRLKNITMNIEPVALISEELLKQRAEWLNKEKEPKYKAIKSFEDFGTLMNIVYQSQ